MVIKRSLYPIIQAHILQKEITIIAGPRQAGKTYLIKQLQADLDNQGIKTLYFNLDFDDQKKYFVSQNALLKKLKLEFGTSSGTVFIDEIQRKTDAGIFLKGLYDRQTPYKFVVSGSGSLELKEKIHESLAGRKQIFYLSTLTFKEFLNCKTEYKYEGKIKDFFATESEAALSFLNEYLAFGGYPRVVLTDTAAAKLEIIKDIYQSYIERDITLLLNLEKTEQLSQLLRLLADQNGNLINYSSLGQTVGLSVPTVKNYLWYLEKTFIIDRLPPFTHRTGREISKSPVVYFSDIGMRNFINNTFEEPLRDSDLGLKYQTLLVHVLKENVNKDNSQLFYWRTKDGAEVDFVRQSGQNVEPIEAKFNWTNNPPVSLVNFSKKYQAQKGLVVTKNNLFELF